MDKIKGKVNIELSFGEVFEINKMIDRERPLLGKANDDESINYCPKCNAKFAQLDKYCAMCGQRVRFATVPNDPIIVPL